MPEFFFTLKGDVILLYFFAVIVGRNVNNIQLLILMMGKNYE